MLESNFLPSDNTRSTRNVNVSRYSGPEEAQSDEDRYLESQELKSDGEIPNAKTQTLIKTVMVILRTQLQIGLTSMEPK